MLQAAREGEERGSKPRSGEVYSNEAFHIHGARHTLANLIQRLQARDRGRRGWERRGLGLSPFAPRVSSLARASRPSEFPRSFRRPQLRKLTPSRSVDVHVCGCAKVRGICQMQYRYVGWQR